MSVLKDYPPFNGDSFLCEEFLALKHKFEIETAVETGTFMGSTTLWLSNNFGKVHTTELKKEYYEGAIVNLHGASNITFWNQSSIEALPEILKHCTNKTVIFLDAHWYENPLLKELEIIAASGLKPIIAIHDFKNPNHTDYGYDVYPDQKIVYEWKWIESRVKAIYGEGNFEHYYNDKAIGAKRGCVFITPKS